MKYNITLTIEDSMYEEAIDILAANFGYGKPTLNGVIKGEGMTKAEFVMKEEEAYLKRLVVGTISKAKEKAAILEAKKAKAIIEDAINFEIVGNI